MRRFEFSDGKSNKFWEIDLEGDSFTVRYGRIGTEGQSSTKTYASAQEATKQADKLIAAKTKKGYQEVEASAPAPAKSGNPELEQAIHDDPNDLDAWAVYGDWLQENDDPRGELVSLEVLAARGQDNDASAKRRADLMEVHSAAWLGPVLSKSAEGGDEAILKHEWKFGFLHSVRLGAAWDAEGPTVAEALRAMLKLESAKFLHKLSFGVTDLEGETDFNDVMLPLSKVGKLPSLRHLTVGDYDYEEQEITWVVVGNVGRLWPVLPNLEFLKVRGGAIELGSVSHDKLQHFVIETAGLTQDAVRSLAAARLPALTTLEAWLGEEGRSEEHGEHASIDDLRPLLSAEGTPALQHLGLKNGDYADEVAVALCTAPILKQLETLDLSMGTMAEVGARALVQHADLFKHIERIDLEENAIDAPEVEALTSAFGARVNIGDQEPSDDPEDRYVSVSE